MIDFHAHTSNRMLYGLHTTDASIVQLELLAKRHGIETIVLMATYFPFKKSGLPNKQLLDRVKGKDLFTVFGSLDASGDLSAGLDELASLISTGQIAGIKLYPGYQNFDLGDTKMFPVYELAQSYRLPVAIHGGELHHCCPVESRNTGNRKCGSQFCWIDRLQDLSHPNQLRPAALAFPQVSFVFCHLGNPYFEETRKLMAECANVYTDISGQFVSGTTEDSPEYRELITREIKLFLNLSNGSQHVIFASDFPIQSYPDSISLVESLGLTSAEIERLCQTNAQQLLNQRRRSS